MKKSVLPIILRDPKDNILLKAEGISTYLYEIGLDHNLWPELLAIIRHKRILMSEKPDQKTMHMYFLSDIQKGIVKLVNSKKNFSKNTTNKTEQRKIIPKTSARRIYHIAYIWDQIYNQEKRQLWLDI